jgi:hypothetical protein
MTKYGVTRFTVNDQLTSKHNQGLHKQEQLKVFEKSLGLADPVRD